MGFRLHRNPPDSFGSLAASKFMFNGDGPQSLRLFWGCEHFERMRGAFKFDSAPGMPCTARLFIGREAKLKVFMTADSPGLAMHEVGVAGRTMAEASSIGFDAAIDPAHFCAGHPLDRGFVLRMRRWHAEQHACVGSSCPRWAAALHRFQCKGVPSPTMSSC